MFLKTSAFFPQFDKWAQNMSPAVAMFLKQPGQIYSLAKENLPRCQQSLPGRWMADILGSKVGHLGVALFLTTA